MKRGVSLEGGPMVASPKRGCRERKLMVCWALYSKALEDDSRHLFIEHREPSNFEQDINQRVRRAANRAGGSRQTETSRYSHDIASMTTASMYGIE